MRLPGCLFFQAARAGVEPAIANVVPPAFAIREKLMQRTDSQPFGPDAARVYWKRGRTFFRYHSIFSIAATQCAGLNFPVAKRAMISNTESAKPPMFMMSARSFTWVLA